jgi:nucleoside-diphosphate-sugar epimerase
VTKLIFGCGYLGIRVARRWLAAGETVYALTRSAERAAALAREGIRPLVGDVTRPETLPNLPAADTVLFAIGHDAESGRSIRDTYVGGLKNVLAALSPAIGRFIYVSSTGVYGDHGGGWVDEQTECRPTRAAGRACLEAEQTLLAHPLADRAIILRLAGLYGPGRIPRQADLIAGEPIDAPQAGYLNLIHVDDAASAVLAAEMAYLALPRCYLVSDGNPVVRGEYYHELARLLGAPAVRFREPGSTGAATARAAADKRIANSRMLAELGVRLGYPSYREGLSAIVAG